MSDAEAHDLDILLYCTRWCKLTVKLVRAGSWNWEDLFSGFWDTKCKSRWQTFEWSWLNLLTVVPNIFGTRDQFCGRHVFHRLVLGVGDGLGMIQSHLLCVLFLSWLHQFHLRLSGTRSPGLGTPVLRNPHCSAQQENCCDSVVCWMMWLTTTTVWSWYLPAFPSGWYSGKHTVI